MFLQRHFSEIVLFLLTAVISCGLKLLWTPDFVVLQVLLLIGAALCEFAAAVALVFYYKSKWGSKEKFLFDCKEYDRVISIYMLCCVVLAVVMCIVAQDLAWIAMSVALMILTILVGTNFFAAGEDVIIGTRI